MYAFVRAGLVGVLACFLAGAAWAQAPLTVPQAAEGLALDPPERPRPPRPRLSLSIGMGASFDGVGFPDGRRAVPSFFAIGGVGDGLFGVDFLAFSSAASGRDRAANPVDRVALDGFAVVRPAAGLRPEDQGYALRVLRTFGVELGVGLERDGRSMIAGSRFTVHTGARVELPLTPIGEPSEVRLRLGVRRAFGLYTPTLQGRTPGDRTEVGDTALELYAALAVVF
jgi:hypothetical protein